MDLALKINAIILAYILVIGFVCSINQRRNP